MKFASVKALWIKEAKKAERVFSNAIDYINGSKNTNSLIKAAATFYRVAKEG